MAETSRRGAPSSATEAVPLSQPTFPGGLLARGTLRVLLYPILRWVSSTSASRAAPRDTVRQAAPAGYRGTLGVRQAASGEGWGALGRVRPEGAAPKGLCSSYRRRPGSPCAALQPRGTLHKRGSGWAVRGGMYAAGGRSVELGDERVDLPRHSRRQWRLVESSSQDPSIPSQHELRKSSGRIPCARPSPRSRWSGLSGTSAGRRSRPIFSPRRTISRIGWRVRSWPKYTRAVDRGQHEKTTPWSAHLVVIRASSST